MKKVIIIYSAVIAVLACAFGFLLVMHFQKTNYDLVRPASLNNLSAQFSVEGDEYKSKTNIYSVSVYEDYLVNPIKAFFAKSCKYVVIDEHYEYSTTDYEVARRAGVVQKSNSLTQSLICAITTLNSSEITLDYNYNGQIVAGVYGNNIGVLSSGDIILEVEGIALKQGEKIANILADLYGVIKVGEHYYVDLTSKDEYSFKILRGEEELEVMLTPTLYKVEDVEIKVFMFDNYDNFKVDNIEPMIYVADAKSIGPSAGLMQTISLYLMLSKNDSFDDLVISGTGTINYAGRVGEIGGIESKVCSAIVAGVDIFFVPSANYEAALATYNKFKTDMRLVKVDTFAEALAALEEMVG